MVVEANNPDERLWTWSALCTALDLSEEAGPDVRRVHIDSRSTEPGDLFIALPGDPGPRFNPSYRSHNDGHDYLEDALAQGAVGALVHRDCWGGMRTLRISDTYDGLWRLGEAAQQRMAGVRFAITGSSGKTTAKSFLATALNGYTAPANFNNHIGVPLSLANMPADTKWGVFEIGTNHPGEIEPLSKLVQPEFALVLNVGVAHIENFASTDELYKEKVSILNGLTNKDHLVWEESLGLSCGHAFGTSSQSSVRLINCEGDKAQIQVFGKPITARVPGGGTHRALTLTAVLALISLAGADLSAAAELPATLIPPGRGNEIFVNGVTLVDDSYNANPASMLAAIEDLSKRTDQRCIAVLGEMLELGEASSSAHETVIAKARELDGLICVGQGFADAAREAGLRYFDEADEGLAEHLQKLCQSGDRLLIKGSNRVFWQADFAARLAELLT